MFWKAVDEDFVGGYLMLDLTGTGLIKAQGHAQLAARSGCIADDAVAHWKRTVFFGWKVFPSALSHPGP